MKESHSNRHVPIECRTPEIRRNSQKHSLAYPEKRAECRSKTHSTNILHHLPLDWRKGLSLSRRKKKKKEKVRLSIIVAESIVPRDISYSPSLEVSARYDRWTCIRRTMMRIKAVWVCTVYTNTRTHIQRTGMKLLSIASSAFRSTAQSRWFSADLTFFLKILGEKCKVHTLLSDKLQARLVVNFSDRSKLVSFGN